MQANGLSDEVLLHWLLHMIATTTELQGNVSLPHPYSSNPGVVYTKKYVAVGMPL